MQISWGPIQYLLVQNQSRSKHLMHAKTPRRSPALIFQIISATSFKESRIDRPHANYSWQVQEDDWLAARLGAEVGPIALCGAGARECWRETGRQATFSLFLNYADIDNIELSKVKQLAIDLVQIPRENVESRCPALG